MARSPGALRGHERREMFARAGLSPAHQTVSRITEVEVENARVALAPMSSRRCTWPNAMPRPTPVPICLGRS
jgi:hypothetical protein